MRGVDMSHYQKGLTIKQVKDAGNEFAIIKVTEGTWLVDAAAFEFYREAYEAGFPVGCYCYSHATTVEDAAKEAQFLLDTINRFPMPCGVFLDMEEPKQLGLAKEKLLSIIAAWGNAIAEAGYIPGVYSSAGTLWQKISPDEVDDGCLAWVAKWSQQPPDTPCDLWQNSDSGRVEGYDGQVDTDVARSDRFRTLVKMGFPERKEEPAAPDACPIDEPCEQEKEPEVSGAFAMLAEYLQTKEFQENFLSYIERRNKK